MARNPTSVNLEEEHREWMDRENLNRSDFINHLIDAYRGGSGVVETTMNHYRKREIQTEMQSLERKLEILEEEYEELDRDLTSTGEAKAVVLDQAADTLSSHQLHADSNPVEFWANKAEMDKEEFLSEMEDRVDE